MLVIIMISRLSYTRILWNTSTGASALQVMQSLKTISRYPITQSRHRRPDDAFHMRNDFVKETSFLTQLAPVSWAKTKNHAVEIKSDMKLRKHLTLYLHIWDDEKSTESQWRENEIHYGAPRTHITRFTGLVSIVWALRRENLGGRGISLDTTKNKNLIRSAANAKVDRISSQRERSFSSPASLTMWQKPLFSNAR